MTDLVLAIACGLAIAMIFKVAAQTHLDTLTLLTANYAAAAFISLAALLAGDADTGTSPTAGFIALAVVTGSLFIVGFFMLALATDAAGMSLATAVMRISVVLPFTASWVVWAEVPSPAQGIGLVTACVAFFLIAYRPAASGSSTASMSLIVPKPDRRAFVLLALLFVIGGTIDTLLKAFDEVFSGTNSRAAYMTLAFGVAFAAGAAGLGMRRRRPLQVTAIVWGFALGAVNVASVEFILRAIRQLSGPFVFPANNIGLVIGGALLGVTIWNERLTGLNWLGLALAGTALFLLSD